MAEMRGGNPRSGLDLPDEVLKLVLSQLPLSDLLTTTVTVCRHWSKVILAPDFLPWKKLYHQVKEAPDTLGSTLLLHPDQAQERMGVKEVVSALCDRYAITTLSNCFVNIIKVMGMTHNKTLPDPDPTLVILERHPLYRTALATLRHLYLLHPSQHYNTWHVVTMIVLLSVDMWQVDSVLRLLLHWGSVYTCRDVVEAFYCLATFLLHCNRTLRLPTRYHYIVYYALYLYENSWAGIPLEDPGTLRHRHSGQQSIMQFLLRTSTICHTHEQMRIINHNIQSDHVVKIVAFAGTGKTTTLLQFCKERPYQKFLLVVFNKSVKEHCSHLFPSNTHTNTAHALAYRFVGRKYAAVHKLEGNLKASEIASLLEKRKGTGNWLRRAALVTSTLEQFFCSTSDTLTLEHVPTIDKQEKIIDTNHRMVFLSDAKDMWAEMKLCKDTQRLSMTQDGQLKLWQLKKPQLTEYDIIMVDEAQDMNAAMFDIFLRQPCAKVVVGDPYQQIYRFRGAMNALDLVPATHTFHLTQSFRFGPEIGYAAHCVLEELLGVRHHTLVGGRCHDTITAAPDSREFLIGQEKNMQGQQPQEAASASVDENSQSRKTILANMTNKGQVVKRAYLARTNLEIYKVALVLCKEDGFKTASMAFSGGIENYSYDTVMDIYKLNLKNRHLGTAESLAISNKRIAKFRSVESLKSHAKDLEDYELLNKIEMYEYSGPRTPTHLDLLKKRCNHNIKSEQADITFSTIHKAKGMEWDWVILLDDFIPPTQQTKCADHREAKDEINLLYVAITRAKHFLTLNTAAYYSLTTAAKEKFEVLVPRSGVPEGRECLQCSKSIPAGPPSPLLTQASPLKLSHCGTSFAGGYVCNTCAKTSTFALRCTNRYPKVHDARLVRDTSRVVRRILIEGKNTFTPNSSFNICEAGTAVPTTAATTTNTAIGSATTTTTAIGAATTTTTAIGAATTTTTTAIGVATATTTATAAIGASLEEMAGPSQQAATASPSRKWVHLDRLASPPPADQDRSEMMEDSEMPESPESLFHCHHPECDDQWENFNGHKMCLFHSECVQDDMFDPEHCKVCAPWVAEIESMQPAHIVTSTPYILLCRRWHDALNLFDGVSRTTLQWRNKELQLRLNQSRSPSLSSSESQDKVILTAASPHLQQSLQPDGDEITVTQQDLMRVVSQSPSSSRDNPPNPLDHQPYPLTMSSSFTVDNLPKSSDDDYMDEIDTQARYTADSLDFLTQSNTEGVQNRRESVRPGRYLEGTSDRKPHKKRRLAVKEDHHMISSDSDTSDDVGLDSGVETTPTKVVPWRKVPKTYKVMVDHSDTKFTLMNTKMQALLGFELCRTETGWQMREKKT